MGVHLLKSYPSTKSAALGVCQLGFMGGLFGPWRGIESSKFRLLLLLLLLLLDEEFIIRGGEAVSFWLT